MLGHEAQVDGDELLDQPINKTLLFGNYCHDNC